MTLNKLAKLEKDLKILKELEKTSTNLSKKIVDLKLSIAIDKEELKNDVFKAGRK